MATTEAAPPRPGVDELVACATVLLLPVVFHPSALASFWSPKAAVLLVAGGLGLSRVPQLLRSDLRAPTLAALAFAGVATASAALSPRPVEATFGVYNWGTGLVFVVCLLGVFALGASAGDGRRLGSALVAGCAISGTAAVLQTITTLPIDVLDAGDRAIGLVGDPVQLGTIGCLGLALCAWRATESWPWLLGVAGFATTVQLSGTRAALAVGIVALVAIGVARAPRRLGHLVAAATAGFLLGTALAASSGQPVDTATSRGLDGTALSAAAGGGLRVRGEVWLSSRHAVADRPLLGAGPGRFRAATSPYRTEAMVRAEGPALFTDAHNLGVEYLVTTGVLGLAALVGWLVLAVRRARGPLLGVTLTALAAMATQPQSVSTTPLLFLALGAAASVTLPRPSALASVAAPVATFVGAAAAIALLAGDISLLAARRDFDLTAARRADVLLRPWSEPASARATIHEFRALDADDDATRAAERGLVRQWRRVAVERDPTRPSLWLALAEEQRQDGLEEEAEASEREALRLDPFADVD